ncbi:unnamed protein product [Cuscuta campestris]|uniref:Uncharacterized protein n=1 Tax=Cuscuta campestris TaxID=132261 RepID=A0A484KJB4_9ASTE|nr:unnamed protein product [Cuscuta campestris]
MFGPGHDVGIGFGFPGNSPNCKSDPPSKLPNCRPPPLAVVRSDVKLAFTSKPGIPAIRNGSSDFCGGAAGGRRFGGEDGVAVVVEEDRLEEEEEEVEEEDEEEEERLVELLRVPPPTGMFLRAPPLVQYLLQFLQKWRG